MLEKTTNSYAGHFRDPRTALIEPAAATRGRGAYQPRLRRRPRRTERRCQNVDALLTDRLRIRQCAGYCAHRHVSYR